MADPRLHQLHLSSPSLPIGAYAYSQGLEYAIEAGWVDGDDLQQWLLDGLELGLAQLELPALLRMMQGLEHDEIAALDHWNNRVLANRETSELLLEDEQIGGALWRLLGQLDPAPLPTLQRGPSYVTAYAVACHRWGIEADDALPAFAYSWLENQVSAATKLVPLGQSDAQRLLVSLLDRIPDVCTRAAAVIDACIGLSLPGLALASCRHEHQHTRLFRS